jgi:hypothetical protein
MLPFNRFRHLLRHIVLISWLAVAQCRPPLGRIKNQRHIRYGSPIWDILTTRYVL